MQIVAQLIFGWPSIIIFIVVATIGVSLNSKKLVSIALVLSLGPSLYLIGASNWVQLVGLYIPLSLVISIVLIGHNRFLIPKVLMGPIYCFYIWFGYVIANQ